MPFTDYLLYRLARRWPSPIAEMNQRLGGVPGSDEYNRAYAIDQFNRKVRSGLQFPVLDQDVLEIGCGHGGISCFLAAAGARSVVGIDLNDHHLEFAAGFAEEMSSRLCPGGQLKVRFQAMNAYEMTFSPDSFDVVLADNTFEHFMQPRTVMEQSWRVLRPGGRLLVPIFSSIYSKYGTHTKQSLKLPWANLFCSEKTIVRAIRRLADENPNLHNLYPKLKDSAENLRDLRRHGDLNDITYKKFKRMAIETGYQIEWFRPNATRFGKLINLTPLLKHTLLSDIFSIGASACLRKPKAP